MIVLFLLTAWPCISLISSHYFPLKASGLSPGHIPWQAFVDSWSTLKYFAIHDRNKSET